MNNKILVGVCYVSIWVLIWGTVGSLIDFPLLKAEIYSSGSISQVITFAITALFCIFAGIKLFPKVNNG